MKYMVDAKPKKARKAKPQDFQDRLRNFRKTIVKAQADFDARNNMRDRRIQAEKKMQEDIKDEIAGIVRASPATSASPSTPLIAPSTASRPGPRAPTRASRPAALAGRRPAAACSVRLAAPP